MTAERKSRRPQDWPIKLAAILEARRNLPFQWGEQDCCLFSCDVVKELTGVDLAGGNLFRGRYNSAKGAAEVLAEHRGVEAIAERQCLAHGFDEHAAVRLAKRGDMVLFDSVKHGPALGICDGLKSWFTGPVGLVAVPTAKCRRAWRVD